MLIFQNLLLYLPYRLNQVQDELYLLDLGSKKKTRLGSERCVQINAYSYRDEPWLLATFKGFTRPSVMYKYDFTSEKKDERWKVYRSVEAPGLKHEDFKVDQIWYKARDGTKVPMFTLRHKDTPEKGVPILQYGKNLEVFWSLSSSRTHATGYGGFDISLEPSFDSALLTFLKHYPILYVMPNIRGGGEFGTGWYHAAIKEKKASTPIPCARTFSIYTYC